MNKIREDVRGILSLQRELGVNVVDGASENMIKAFEDKAYEIGAVHLLVNVSDLDKNRVNISDFERGEDGDYEVITSQGQVEINGEYITFSSSEEYNSYLEENELDESEYPDWWDFAEESETYWNWFYSFYNEINLELANRLGLPVIRFNSTDNEYVSISGCGMDLSFQMIQYQALAHGEIEEEYATPSRLDWAKTNLSEENYIEMLIALGVDIDRLDKKHYIKS